MEGTAVRNMRACAGVNEGVIVAVGNWVKVAVDVLVSVTVWVNVCVGDGPGV